MRKLKEEKIEKYKLKKTFKRKKGITLIALIITVIVMLILAGISISVLTSNEGLFEKTQIAVDVYNQAVQDESAQISRLLNEINGYLVKVDRSVYIYTKEDLDNFREEVNNGNSYKGYTINLMNDIDLGGDENDSTTWWEPIGWRKSLEEEKRYFSGIFNGNGYEISGMYNNYEEMSTIGVTSFFTGINSATINNLTLSGNYVLADDISGVRCLAASGFVGDVCGDSSILNCTNKINLTKNFSGRDIAGFVNALSENATLTIKDCVNYGNITGSSNCGGFVGNVRFGKMLVMENCCNEGNITNYVGNYAGGLIGRDAEAGDSTIIINNSYNKGTIRSGRYGGGLVGQMVDNLIINNSYNSGTIYSERQIGSAIVGGLVGRVLQASPSCIIINSYNTANIVVSELNDSVNAGGLVGIVVADNTDIINCYNLGDIGNSTRASGICLVHAPSNTSPTLNMKNCYNKGSVNGIDTSGLIILLSPHIAVNMDKVYYLNSISNVGILDLNGTNTIQGTTTPLSEAEMKEQQFVEQLNGNIAELNTVVSELNDNVRDLNIQFTLKRWKHTVGDYPSFE